MRALNGRTAMTSKIEAIRWLMGTAQFSNNEQFNEKANIKARVYDKLVIVNNAKIKNPF